MKPHIWTVEETALLRRAYADTPTAELAARLGLTVNQVYDKARLLGIKKSAAYKKTGHAGCFLPGEQRGRATEFKPGQAPHNKGKKFNAGGRSAEHRFKAGHRPANTAPVGTVVTDSYGYLKQKIAKNRGRHGWQFVHRLVWEAAHGPLPADHIIVFKDGNKRNVALANLACISRTENMARNSIQRYPDELKKTIRIVAKLNKTIEDSNHEKQDRRSQKSSIRHSRGFAGQRRADGN